MLVGNGWAFIHIPKCGGTSIRTALQGVEVAEVLPTTTADHQFHWIARAKPPGRVFCVVRHPASWLASYWGHRERHGWRDKMALDCFRSDSLTEFMIGVATHAAGYVSRLFAQYVDAYPGIEVFRLEDGLAAPLQVAGYRGAVPHANGGDLPTISPFARTVVCAAEAKAVQRFGYQ